MGDEEEKNDEVEREIKPKRIRKAVILAPLVLSCELVKILRTFQL